MKVVLIHNPHAGEAEDVSGDDLMEMIRGAGYTVEYVSSTDRRWPEKIKSPAEILAVAGGDGLVGKVVKNNIGLDRPIAVLPLGTANNIAYTLGLAGKTLDRWIVEWMSARRGKFSVCVAEGPWGSRNFIEGAGVGIFSDVMARLDARENIELAHANGASEKLSSVLELMIAEAGACPARRLHVSLDGEDFSGDYVLLEAMNIKAIGPNLQLAPLTDPGDNSLDVVCVPADEREKLTSYLTAHLETKLIPFDLTVRRGKHLELTWEGSSVHIDDEAWPGTNDEVPEAPAKIDIQLGAASISFLVPA
jgi:diacylglycerol kinase family enzyme